MQWFVEILMILQQHSFNMHVFDGRRSAACCWGAEATKTMKTATSCFHLSLHPNSIPQPAVKAAIRSL